MSPKEVRKNLHHQIWYSVTNQEEKEIEENIFSNMQILSLTPNKKRKNNESDNDISIIFPVLGNAPVAKKRGISPLNIILFKLCFLYRYAQKISRTL